MQGKVVLVTGSTDGIGLETARQLARLGATIILHGRNYQTGPDLRDQIKRETGNEHIDYVNADLSKRDKLHALTDHIKSQYGVLDVLIHNAGVFMTERKLTPEGLEMTFAVNHLAPFILTGLLLPCLKNAEQGRIITVSSIAHQNAHLDFNNLQGEVHFDPYKAYALSKLGNILFTYYLAEHLKGSKVTANTLHPGVITTKLLKTGFNRTGASIEEGADTSVYLAYSPEVSEISGGYFIKRKRTASSPASNDQHTINDFWKISAELSGVSYVF
ncbi:MAG: hypothetical protein FMNOHCHN_00094 [Ignavibacteriaceae bacterium]|nr:hypothetical protein [Ignavibacteriaceae bacterium]